MVFHTFDPDLAIDDMIEICRQRWENEKIGIASYPDVSVIVFYVLVHSFCE